MRELPSPGVLQPIGRTHQILCSAEVGVAWLENGGPHEDVPNPEGSREGYPEVDQITFIVPERKESEETRKILSKYLKDWIGKRQKELDDQVKKFLLDRQCPHCDEVKDDIGMRCRQGSCETVFSCKSCFQFPMAKWKRELGKHMLRPIPESTFDYLNHPG